MKSLWMSAGVLALVVLAMSNPAGAYTAQAITGVRTAVGVWTGIVQAIGYAVGVGLIIFSVIQARGGHGVAALVEFASAIIVCAIMFYAEEIAGAIKPGIAQASTGTGVMLLYLPTWSEFLMGSLLLSGMTESLRRWRHGRR